MDRIEWNQAYEVGIVDIDVEHRRLVCKLNLFLDLASDFSVTPKVELERLFVDLIEFTKFHFGHEEEIMAELGCADLIEHQETHNRLLDEIIEFQEKHNRGELVFDQKFIQYLTQWMMDHLMEEVEQIADCVKNNCFVNSNSAV